MPERAYTVQVATDDAPPVLVSQEGGIPILTEKLGPIIAELRGAMVAMPYKADSDRLVPIIAKLEELRGEG